MWFDILKNETGPEQVKRIILELVEKHPLLKVESLIQKYERDTKNFPKAKGRGVSDLRFEGDVRSDTSPEFLEEKERRKKMTREEKEENAAWREGLVRDQKNVKEEQEEYDDEFLNLRVLYAKNASNQWDERAGKRTGAEGGSMSFLDETGRTKDMLHQIREDTESGESAPMQSLAMHLSPSGIYQQLETEFKDKNRKPTDEEVEKHVKGIIYHEMGHISHYLADFKDFWQVDTEEFRQAMARNQFDGRHNPLKLKMIQNAEKVAHHMQYLMVKPYESLLEMSQHPGMLDTLRLISEGADASKGMDVRQLIYERMNAQQKRKAREGKQTRHQFNQHVRKLLTLPHEILLNYAERHASTSKDRNQLLRYELQFRRYMDPKILNNPPMTRDREGYERMLSRYNERAFYPKGQIDDDTDVSRLINPEKVSEEYQTEKKRFINSLFRGKLGTQGKTTGQRKKRQPKKRKDKKSKWGKKKDEEKDEDKGEE